jgi:hypothetical protein
MAYCCYSLNGILLLFAYINWIMFYVRSFSSLRELAIQKMLYSFTKLYIASRNEESGHEILVQYVHCWLPELWGNAWQRNIVMSVGVQEPVRLFCIGNCKTVMWMGWLLFSVGRFAARQWTTQQHLLAAYHCSSSCRIAAAFVLSLRTERRSLTSQLSNSCIL